MNNTPYTRTDLAAEYAAGTANGQIPGISVEQSTENDLPVTTVTVLNNEGEEQIGKPIGTYITVDLGKVWLFDDNTHSKAVEAVSNIIKKLNEKLIGQKDLYKVLVVGLGNRYITSDAVGPLTVKNITVTSHVMTADPALFQQVGKHSLSAVAPGVSGQTGIETVQLIKSAVDSSSPDIIIAIDALAARNTDRLGTTIQICDTGIAPGSGIGNHSKAINQQNLGVPVIAIGIPTMVSSSTLVYDALEKGGVTQIDNQLTEVLENGKSFFVTLNETDTVVSSVSALIGSAIDLAFSRHSA